MYLLLVENKFSTSFLVGGVSLFICPFVNDAISSELVRVILMKLSGIIRVYLVWNEFKFFSAKSKVKVKVLKNIKNTFLAVTLSIFKILTCGLLHIEAWWNPIWVRAICLWRHTGSNASKSTLKNRHFYIFVKFCFLVKTIICTRRVLHKTPYHQFSSF